MRTFGKSSKLDNVLYDVRGPVVDEAARMEEDGMEILKLNIGNPYPFGFSAPQEVICVAAPCPWLQSPRKQQMPPAQRRR